MRVHSTMYPVAAGFNGDVIGRCALHFKYNSVPSGSGVVITSPTRACGLAAVMMLAGETSE